MLEDVTGPRYTFFGHQTRISRYAIQNTQIVGFANFAQISSVNKKLHDFNFMEPKVNS
jgi:hypothetical protein